MLRLSEGFAAQPDGSSGGQGVRVRAFSRGRVVRVGAALNGLLDPPNPAPQPEQKEVLLPGGAAAFLLQDLQRRQLHFRVPRKRHTQKVPVQGVLHARFP